MFVRIKTSPNSPKKAVQIVENVRDGNKVKQRIIRHVGAALNEEELERLKDLAEFIRANIEHAEQPGLLSAEHMAQMAIQARKKKDDTPLPVNVKDLREQKRIILGIHEVYGELYQELRFDKVIPARKKAAQQNLFHIAMGRIANPLSKMATVNDLEENFGISLSLPSVYRMMDAIDESVTDKIQKSAWQSVAGLFVEPVKVVFYDLTTLYFESFTEDELKKYGYSKDMKFNQSQVLLAIIVTEHGLPIGYEIYEGSTYEGHTLKDALKKLEERFGVKDITFVADSALLSKANIQLLEQMQKQYILGARLKNLPKEVKEKILDKDTFTGTELLYKEIPYNGKRLIVTLSPMKAKKDAHDRQKAIDNLLSKLDNSNPTAFISNFGYKRFIKIDGDAKVKLDEEKIQENARWDGIHGVITNNSTLTPAQVIEQYHGLWQVEETFRITKHDIKVRPIFHWTPKRIKAHIAICFIALCLIRHLQFRMKVVGKPLSAEKIRRALISAQASIVKDIKTNRLYGIPSVVSQHTKEIYKAIGIKINAVPFTLG